MASLYWTNAVDTALLLSFFRLYGIGDGIFVALASAKFIADYVCRNVKNFCPFNKAHRFSIAGQESIIPFISMLFFARSPSAIVRFVVAVIVREAVNAVLWRWSWSHVGQECFKGIKPSLANGYSPSSPFGIIMAITVVASCFHPLPNSVFRALCCASSSCLVSGSWNTLNGRHDALLFSVLWLEPAKRIQRFAGSCHFMHDGRA